MDRSVNQPPRVIDKKKIFHCFQSTWDIILWSLLPRLINFWISYKTVFTAKTNVIKDNRFRCACIKCMWHRTCELQITQPYTSQHEMHSLTQVDTLPLRAWTWTISSPHSQNEADTKFIATRKADCRIVQDPVPVYLPLFSPFSSPHSQLHTVAKNKQQQS